MGEEVFHSGSSSQCHGGIKMGSQDGIEMKSENIGSSSSLIIIPSCGNSGGSCRQST